jgi:hypothetical protein
VVIDDLQVLSGNFRCFIGPFFVHFEPQNTIFSFGSPCPQRRSAENLTVSFFLFSKGGLMGARNESEERKTGKKERAGCVFRVARAQ